MCVICVKPVGVEVPSGDRMEEMFSSNKDGAGFMFVRDNQVHIRKGFMKLKSLKKALDADEITADDLLVLHFRIATAGSVAPRNCHPFPISNDISDLRSQRLSTDIAMAHNGILSYPADTKHDLSDTMSFIKDVLAEPSVRTNLFDSSVSYLVEGSIGASKMVFVNGMGDFLLLGTWYEDTPKDGCFYSNTFFKRTISYFRGSAKDDDTRFHVDYSKYEIKNDQYDTQRSSSASESTQKFAEGQAVNLTVIDYDASNCPDCRYPIASYQQLACSKCGVVFYREHDMVH